MSLRLVDVAFTYPGADRAVLYGVDLAVDAGEAVALMGASGRGKTTLLNVAGLLAPPSSGRVEIDGRACSVRDRRAQRIAWILQSVNLLPRRSALDNVALPALAAGASPSVAETHAADLLRGVGLDPWDRRDARTLSGGEAQRVGLARALVSRPSVLLADEPTANLDARTAEMVAEALVSVSDHTAVLLATHDERVGAMADRIVRLTPDGSLEED